MIIDIFVIMHESEKTLSSPSLKHKLIFFNQKISCFTGDEIYQHYDESFISLTQYEINPISLMTKL